MSIARSVMVGLCHPVKTTFITKISYKNSNTTYIKKRKKHKSQVNVVFARPLFPIETSYDYTGHQQRVYRIIYTHTSLSPCRMRMSDLIDFPGVSESELSRACAPNHLVANPHLSPAIKRNPHPRARANK